MAKKTIITVATTGAWPKKENNPNVPMTPREIAEDVYDCWQAGAAIAHLHMRDDEGNGSMDTAKFRETVELLRGEHPDCDIVLNMTTSGALINGRGPAQGASAVSCALRWAPLTAAA